MKRLIIIATILIITTAQAFAGWNLNFWGSNDKQKKQRYTVSQPVKPNDPVSVPEPGTLILLGGGLVALAGWRKLRGGK